MKISNPAEPTGIQVLILAGGEGERLLPLTIFRPKPAIPFGGTFRIIDFTLFNSLDSGLTEVALLTQYKREELEAYIRTRWRERWYQSRRLGELRCLSPVSGKRYRGTADAVLQNLPVISPTQTQHVLVLSGDHVYRMDYRELLRQHAETDADVTISTVECPLRDAKDFGVVEVGSDLKVVGFLEKPREPRPLPQRPGVALISMGVYVFKMQALLEILHTTCNNGFGYDFGHHVIPSMIGSARVYAYDFRDEALKTPCYWRDIGTIDSYYAACMDFSSPNPPFDPYGNCGRDYGHATPPVASLSGDAFVSRTMLSAGVRIEGGAVIEDSVLMPGARVGEGARLRRAIIEENVQIPPGFVVGWDLEEDRVRHVVSPGGVVVVSGTPLYKKPIPFRTSRESAVVAYSTARNQAASFSRMARR
jgi:glucose-1-phosphate adenylyltransferase